MSDERRIEGEWARRRSGMMERESRFPSGMVRKEQKNLAYGWTRITDTFPDARRVIYTFGEVLNLALRETNERLKERGESVTSHLRPRVDLVNREKKYTETVTTTALHQLKVFLNGRPQPEDDQAIIYDTNEYDALVCLEYSRGGKVEATVRAEVIWPGEQQALMNWRKSFPLLANYVRTADQDELDVERGVNETLYQNHLEKNFASEQSPAVNSALIAAANLSTGMIEAVYPMREDTALEENEGIKVGKLLGSIGWIPYLKLEILQAMREYNTESAQEAIEKEGGANVFLSEALDKAISLLVAKQKIFPGTPLLITEFSDDAVTTLEQGIISYGEEVMVEDNKFKFSKEGEVITVECLTSAGQERWKSRFPLKIDPENFDQVVKLIEDPEIEEFNEVRPKLGADFEKAA